MDTNQLWQFYMTHQLQSSGVEFNWEKVVLAFFGIIFLSLQLYGAAQQSKIHTAVNSTSAKLAEGAVEMTKKYDVQSTELLNVKSELAAFKEKDRAQQIKDAVDTKS